MADDAAAMKKEYSLLLRSINGQGADATIGAEAARERSQAEYQVVEHHDTQFWGLMGLDDAIYQFYRDTLQLVFTRVSSPSDVELAMVNWHIVSFGRFAAATDLLRRGYYFEAMMLARDLWEVALSLAALKEGVVTLEELTGTGGATTPKAIAVLSRATDRKVRRALIDLNTALDADEREAIDLFIRLANQATHKSKLHLTMNLALTFAGHGVPLFPYFDLKRAGAAHNALSMASWALISTLPYMHVAFPASDTVWHGRYALAHQAFRDGPGNGPDRALKAWRRVIEHIFVQPSISAPTP